MTHEEPTPITLTIQDFLSQHGIDTRLRRQFLPHMNDDGTISLSLWCLNVYQEEVHLLGMLISGGVVTLCGRLDQPTGKEDNFHALYALAEPTCLERLLADISAYLKTRSKPD